MRQSRLEVSAIIFSLVLALTAGAYLYPLDDNHLAPVTKSSARYQLSSTVELAESGIDKPNRAQLTLAESFQKIIRHHLPRNQPEPLAEALGAHLDDTRLLISRLSALPEKPSPILLAQLESKSHEFEVLRTELHERLQTLRNELAGEVEQKAALKSFEQQIQQRFERLQNLIQSVIQGNAGADTEQAISRVTEYIETLQPLRPEVIGPEPTFIAPFEEEKELPGLNETSPPAYIASNAAVPILLASSGHLGALNLALAPPETEDPEAQGCNFVEADLAEATPEVVFDNRILQLAEKLEYNPLQIYEFVANEIDYQSYRGSLKGAMGTLASGAGNAIDQASLLIALMRVSKIPTRYVRGNIQFANSDDRGLNWFGAKAIDAMRKIVSTSFYAGSEGYTIYHHTWVEACVPYDNYRGSRADDSGYHWIPLDPSYQQHDYVQGDTVPVDFSLNDFLYGENGYMLTRSLKLPHEALEEHLVESLGRAIGPIGYHGTKRIIKHDILPGSLPYTVGGFSPWGGGIAEAETPVLPATERYRFEITVSNAVKVLHPTVSFDLPDILLKRVTLRFGDETQKKYNNCATSPKVAPIISIDGIDVVAKNKKKVELCVSDNHVRMDLYRGDDTVKRTIFRYIGSHNYHALNGYALQASDALIEEHSQDLLQSVGQIGNPNDLQDETLGKFLNLVGLKYMDYLTRSNTRISTLYDSYGQLGSHIGVVSTRRKVTYLFDLPFAVEGNGFVVDVQGATVGSYDLTTGEANSDAHVLAGYSGSAYESYIWQEMAHLDAVSSVRGIQFAYQKGIDVLHLDASYLEEKGDRWSKPFSGYPVSILSQLKSVAATGHEVVVPVKLIRYDNWKGYVYVVTTPLGQSSSSLAYTFAIGGGYVTAGGGFTTGSPVSNTYSSNTGTGFQDIYNDKVRNSLSFDSGANLDDFTPVDLGRGSNTGYVSGTTTLSGDPVNLVSGNMYHPERDLVLKGRGGFDFVFERTYNSNIRKDGPLGYGWTHSYQHRLNFFDTTGNNKTDQVIWQDGSGASNSFDVKSNSSGGINKGIAFENQPGLNVIAKRESSGEYSIQEKNGLKYFFEDVNGKPEKMARLLRVVDRNGNSFTLTYDDGNLDSVRDDLDRSLTFHYDDADQHITRVVDWSGRSFRYSYNNNDLISFATPLAIAGQEPPTTYDYYVAADGTNLDHAMESFTRPGGENMRFEYYTNGKVFRHVDAKGQSFTFRYNKFRRETTTVDERGVSQTYLFNEYGQQLSHLQGDGSRMDYKYEDVDDPADPDDFANPLSETLSRNTLGYDTRYDYDDLGNLIESTLPDGSMIRYLGLNSFSQPCTVQDQNGNYQLKRYDDNGNQAETINLRAGTLLTPEQEDSCSYRPPAAAILFHNVNAYDSYGNLRTSKLVRDFTTGEGPTTEYVYDSDGLNPVNVMRCGRQQDISGNLVERCVSAEQEFDVLGRGTTVANADFYHAQFNYDANGRVIRATDDLNQWRDYTYDPNGYLISEILTGSRTDGKVGFYISNTTTYDELRRVKTQRDVAGFASHAEYDETGNAIRISDPDGFSVGFEYDLNNRPVRAFDEQGNEVKTDYDIGGRPITITDPNGNSTQYAYYGAEENGRLQMLISADNRTLEYFYDDNGNVVRTIDNVGRENLTEYDALNRPVRTVGPLHDGHSLPNIRNVTVTYYDNLGDVVQIDAGYTTNLNGADGSDLLLTQAVYRYDDFGRLIEQEDPNGKVTRFVYDDHNNLVEKESPNGHFVEFVYDHERNGLLISSSAKLDASDNNPQVTAYEYNPLGQVTRVTSPEVNYSYGYDAANRLARATDHRGGKILNYEYSPGSRLNFVLDSEGRRVDFLYDAARRLTALIAPNGDQVNFVFDAGGRLRETGIEGGTRSRYSYDAGNKLRTLMNETAGGIVSQHDYGYDELGRRNSHVETIAGDTRIWGFEHDNMDRLTRVLEDAGATIVESYSYDSYGNRRSRLPAGGTAAHYLYDAAHQLTEIRNGSDTGDLTASFSYDENGNLHEQDVGGVTRSLVYDAYERLAEVSGNDIGTETYAYDDRDRRIAKTVDGATTQYLYSGPSIWSEYGSDWSAALAHYSYTGLDQAIIRSAPVTDDTRYYHHDGLGSVVATTNTAGTLQASTRYDAWGNVISGGGIARFGFTGREPDASGLIYYRARYYNPILGRFTQRDPIGLGGGLNPYTYVGNAPQNFTDPLGLTQQAVTAMSSQTSSFSGNNSSAIRVKGPLEWALTEANQQMSEVGGVTGTIWNFFAADAIDAVNSIREGDLSGAAGSAALAIIKPLKLGSKVTNATSRLPDSLAGTFAGGRYTSRVIEKDMVLYRAGDAKKPLGQFFSKNKPISEIQTRIDKAIPPIWPGGAKSPINTAFKVQIPAGTTIHTGRIGSQGNHFLGGTQQVVIEKPWLLNGVKVLEGSPLK